MSILKSFLFNQKETRFNPLTQLHGFLYSATPTYLRILKPLVRSGPPW